jgi:hypothetical protein
MANIEVGNAPCSWGTLEFEGLDINPIGYKQMLDELVETGYTATELGDWGFMPTEPQALRQEIESCKLAMLGAYVQVAFKKPEAHAPGCEEVLKVARLLSASTPGNKPYVILADDNAADPVRTQYAGRATPEIGLIAAEWKVLVRGIQEIARTVREETGLPTGPSALLLRRALCGELRGRVERLHASRTGRPAYTGDGKGRAHPGGDGPGGAQVLRRKAPGKMLRNPIKTKGQAA